MVALQISCDYADKAATLSNVLAHGDRIARAKAVGGHAGGESGSYPRGEHFGLGSAERCRKGVKRSSAHSRPEAFSLHIDATPRSGTVVSASEYRVAVAVRQDRFGSIAPTARPAFQYLLDPDLADEIAILHDCNLAQGFSVEV